MVVFTITEINYFALNLFHALMCLFAIIFVASFFLATFMSLGPGVGKKG